MKLSFRYYAVACLVALASLPSVLLSAASSLVSRVWDYSVALFAPLSIDLRIDDRGLPMVAGGAPLDPALQNSMRHEAGVPRCSADRKV